MTVNGSLEGSIVEAALQRWPIFIFMKGPAQPPAA